MFVIIFPGQTVIGPFETADLARSVAFKAWGPEWRTIVTVWAVEEPHLPLGGQMTPGDRIVETVRDGMYRDPRNEPSNPYSDLPFDLRFGPHVHNSINRTDWPYREHYTAALARYPFLLETGPRPTAYRVGWKHGSGVFVPDTAPVDLVELAISQGCVAECIAEERAARDNS